MKPRPSLIAGLAIAFAVLAQPSLAGDTKTAAGPAAEKSKPGTARVPKQKKADPKKQSGKIKIRPLKKLKDMTDK